MKRPVVLDARPLQPGFKSHHQRGIGRYTNNLISAMLKLYGPDNFEFLIQRGLAKPKLDIKKPFIESGLAPKWLPRGERVVNYHLKINNALNPKWNNGQVVHFLSHLDAPVHIRPQTIITVHDLIFQRLPHLYGGSKGSRFFALKRWLETRSLFKASRLIAVSQQTKKDLMDIYGLPENRITVITEACDPHLGPENDLNKQKEVLARLGIKKPFFLYLGGIDQRKGLDVLLKALCLLKDQGRAYDLVLAGSISKEKQYPALLRDIKQKDLLQSVHLPGFVADEDLPSLFSACLAFVFPSCYEGFGLPPLEAMTMGAPVIATNTSAIPEVVGQAGILIEPDNPLALANAMASLENDPQKKEDLKQKGFQRAKLFSWEKAAEKTWQVYREVGFEG